MLISTTLPDHGSQSAAIPPRAMDVDRPGAKRREPAFLRYSASQGSLPPSLYPQHSQTALRYKSLININKRADDMNDLPIRNYLSEHTVAAGLAPERLHGLSGSPEHLLRLVLDGNAKLPLDKVANVAALIGCDARGLFRVALAQFYSNDTIQLLEHMLAPPERAPAEEAWLSLIRRAAGEGLEPPSRFARRLLWALLNRRCDG